MVPDLLSTRAWGVLILGREVPKENPEAGRFQGALPKPSPPPLVDWGRGNRQVPRPTGPISLLSSDQIPVPLARKGAPPPFERIPCPGLFARPLRICRAGPVCPIAPRAQRNRQASERPLQAGFGSQRRPKGGA